jgi:AcrR family transcriptional regulator
MTKKAEKILNITTKLFIHEGVKKITMDDIAEKANVSKVTIYKYLMDKDTLYLEIGKHIFSQYIEKLDHITASNDALIEKLYDYLNVVSEFINNGQYNLGLELTRYNPDVETVYKQYLQKYKDTIFAFIDMGMRDGLFKSYLDKDIIFHYIDMGFVYYQQSSEYRNKVLNDSSFKQQFLQLYINNIFADGARILSAPCGVI